MVKLADKKERWDIYDKDKNRTGRTMERNVWTLKDDEYHLTVLGVVCRPDGKYLITKRVMSKAWAAGWWEVSGGAAMAGEDSLTAVKREVFEETGLDVTNAKGGYVFTYRRENPGKGDNYFVDVYRFEMDFAEEDLKLQKEETDGYRLATARKGFFFTMTAFKEYFLLPRYPWSRELFEIVEGGENGKSSFRITEYKKVF